MEKIILGLVDSQNNGELQPCGNVALSNENIKCSSLLHCATLTLTLTLTF